jgi:uncharacterized protein YdhG (YjbR/CyaY superfamily)
MNPKPNSIQEYFSWFPPEIQAKLQQMREILQQALPEAEEVISYHMPAFKTSEVLVYYAAAKSHLGKGSHSISVWERFAGATYT